MESTYAIRLIPRRIEPPLDLDWLAEWLGIEVEIRPLPKKVAGIYLRTDWGAHIILNSNDRPERQRWTEAHELAHHILSIGKVSQDSMFQIDVTGSRRDENICDRFAAEILMPSAVVQRKADEVGHGRFDKTALLANMFEVSVMAMRIRLRELGLSHNGR